eukprot:c2844_g1_i1.p1 GENE.c2844_g1_i1~~c2844_g1_i1.p1  ORF type:complete len:156 (+),score=77.12 c2844_g1_i1:91-558(+)
MLFFSSSFSSSLSSSSSLYDSSSDSSSDSDRNIIVSHIAWDSNNSHIIALTIESESLNQSRTRIEIKQSEVILFQTPPNPTLDLTLRPLGSVKKLNNNNNSFPTFVNFSSNINNNNTHSQNNSLLSVCWNDGFVSFCPIVLPFIQSSSKWLKVNE